MKKVLPILLAMILVFSMAVMASAAETKLTIKEVQFDQNADVEPKPQGGGSLANLFDGDATEATAYGTKGVVLFLNKKCKEAGVYTEFTLTVELEKLSWISGVTIDFYQEISSMIGAPKGGEIVVQKSSDGTAFLPAGKISFEADESRTAEKGVVNAPMSFDKDFQAKFLKLTFTYGEYPWTEEETPTDDKVMLEWIGLTEITVLEGAEPAATETEPTKPETEEPTKPETPKTGDGFVALTIAAIVSAAGAAVIVRKTKRV